MDLFGLVEYAILMSHFCFRYRDRIGTSDAMIEVCEIGKCRYYAAIDSMKKAQDMLDTLMKNDRFEEEQAILEK